MYKLMFIFTFIFLFMYFIFQMSPTDSKKEATSSQKKSLKNVQIIERLSARGKISAFGRAGFVTQSMTALGVRTKTAVTISLLICTLSLKGSLPYYRTLNQGYSGVIIYRIRCLWIFLDRKLKEAFGLFAQP